MLPDIFDDREGFEEWFDFSDINAKEGQERILGEESQSGLVSSLHHILKPFLLRRVKTDGITPLPCFALFFIVIVIITVIVIMY